ncbi:MAG: TonB-dependent receptor plug domain-containing protein [Prevotellaceae bacterium]|jgi:iron complex outermembrane receptor protein|nr:TonB-dependent receptor plug domain-containing protein [Prevotellaceae bacterium]
MRRHFFISTLFFGAAVANAQFTPNDSTIHSLNEVTVLSTRMGNQAALSHKVLSESELQTANNGVNLPFLLGKTPSLVITSDDGLGIGYTYFRVRGTDHTRINMTVNGVPLNDSESQTVFWVNMTDFAANLSSVDVQRGVGASTNGAAAFGASVNMQTAKTAANPYATVAFNGGMYNTFRENVQIGTGVLPSGLAFDAHFSKVNSDGYLERAFSDLYSYYGAVSYFKGNSLLKLLVFGGKEQSYQAWDGIDAKTLASNPRYNPAGKYKDDNGNEAFYDNHTDNYAQQNAQLHFSHLFNSRWNLNAALHYTHGAGYYESYKTNAKFSAYELTPSSFVNADGETVKRSDLVRRKQLDNDFYGITAAANYNNAGKLALTFGGAANSYEGDHFGNVLWLRNYLLPVAKDFEYYRNTGKKFDANVYAKGIYNFTKAFSASADVQYRRVNYAISGKNDEGLDKLDIDQKYNFFNPKAGIAYTTNGHSAYATVAIANREPARNNFTESGMHDIPLTERLFDYEIGYNFAHKRFSLGANIYFMDYNNQLVLTGKYSETGAYLTKNVKDSYRAGVELVGGVQILKWLRWDGNLTLSQNKILDFTDWVDDWTSGDQEEINYGKTNISFSPNTTASSTFGLAYKGLSADIHTLAVGKQYLDNTGSDAAMLKAYSVTNVVLAYSVPVKLAKTLTFKLMVNNVFDAHYASNGGAYGYFEDANSEGKFAAKDQKYTPWFYAQAGINVHGGIVINL